MEHLKLWHMTVADLGFLKGPGGSRVVRCTQCPESIATTGTFLGLQLPNILQNITKRGGSLHSWIPSRPATHGIHKTGITAGKASIGFRWHVEQWHIYTSDHLQFIVHKTDTTAAISISLLI